ncbi:HNH endonuclease [Xanthomonas phage FoX2]|uniref:HNH homing endonuclease n=4 Tax=Foxunavirus TaxID=2948712 RepID=A0A858NP65_9CAUD|nr:HNH endonuclease [Xanthomonas phage FoX1]YP_010106745.1 HNH endonuclease [Xanthomonas phage FoX2]YP_010106824.1 HNH endonuclease [Xanthomonas phage FoX3]YP_010106904.1 HNH endonuclease [Xanthomonas phage FoX5]QJB21775.1 HNH homing endonuclease [Xanthomonas phage FoX1]QJB21858.1 HNH homing endonuclease [Xanthomonas phage FoX2]QJB21937.1 HNH homing endonuclease [Xanthomonas phage FoX3]QJB22017.1 HNH homing endonuclease [Xanthomonas phage FoX5]
MRPIPGFEGLYSVTENGEVYSHARIDARGNRRKPKWLRLTNDSDGYPRAHLCVYGSRRKWPVHRLVAMAFIPNPDGMPAVNHLDGVKSNNNVNNLEWCTLSKNTKHAFETGLLANLGRNKLGQFEGKFKWVS